MAVEWIHDELHDCMSTTGTVLPQFDLFFDRLTTIGGASIAQFGLFSGRLATSGALLVSVDTFTPYNSGFFDGRTRGLADGVALGYPRGFDDGEAVGLEEGASSGFPIGVQAGVATVPPSETTPPTVGTVTPDVSEAPGSPGAFPDTYDAAKIVPITIPVVDASSDVAFVVLSVSYSSRPTWETIYAGRPLTDGVAGYFSGYAAASSISGTGAAGVGFTFSVRNDSGWPSRADLPSSITIDIKAVDARGNVLA